MGQSLSLVFRNGDGERASFCMATAQKFWLAGACQFSSNGRATRGHPSLCQARFPVRRRNLGDHCDANQVTCDLIYPGAPNVKHATDNDYIKANLRPELK